MEITEEIKYRICRVCGEEKELQDFAKDRTKKFGRTGICKTCACKYAKEYRQDRKGQIAEANRKYREYHREELNEYLRQYHSKHKEKANVRRRKYYASHREDAIERQKKYEREHKEEGKERNKKYRHSVKGKFTINRNKHRRRARERASKVDLTVDQWHRILKNQKFQCNLCGRKFNKSRPATMDHIVPLVRGGNLTSDNVQALCQSCNSSKHAKIMKGFIASWNYK